MNTCLGFFLGDGAGVGKGRTLSGIISENFLKGRKKHIWLSVSADLRLDADRDLVCLYSSILLVLIFTRITNVT